MDVLLCANVVSIESTGAYQPEELLPEAIDIMLHKIASVEASMRHNYSSLIPAKTEKRASTSTSTARAGQEDPLSVLADAASTASQAEAGKKKGGRKGGKKG